MDMTGFSETRHTLESVFGEIMPSGIFCKNIVYCIAKKARFNAYQQYHCTSHHEQASFRAWSNVLAETLRHRSAYPSVSKVKG